MGLSDLKKKSPQTDVANTPITLDEFINDAELYALGHSRQIVLPGTPRQNDNQPGSATSEQETNNDLKAVFKKATYSMSLECIDHLKLIAENDGMNRSQLLRLFTHYFYQLPPEERDLIYERFSHLFDNNKK
ncbi:CopG family transcriptional regulator [Pseudaeromonas pectinilytica]|jgi:hypothetical protein